MLRRAVAWVLPAALVASAGCSLLEWAGGITHDQLDSARLKPYLDAADRSDRSALGFTPLPRQGPVRVERPRSKTYYDVMLHIAQGNVSRTVDFVLRGDAPEWSGEQEIHYGSREFSTVDGTQREHLVLSYSTVEASGVPKGSYVIYWGPDEALLERSVQKQLSPAEVRAVWDQWSK